MITRTTKSYSKAVVDGLRTMGISSQRICAMTHLKAEKVKAISEGKAAFTDKQLEMIENTVERGTGEIVALTVPHKATAKLLHDLGAFRTELIAYRKSRAAKSA